MEACEKIDEILGVRICKNLFLCNRQATAFYLLLIPADKPFKTKDLSAQIGSSRLSFASHEKMSEILDITPGSLTVLGLMNDLDMDVTLLIDKDLLSCEYFGCHPAINTSTLKFKTSDLTEKLIPALKHRPTVVELPLCEEEG
jgi:Ala-tRNA(Pro) deacylase